MRFLVLQSFYLNRKEKHAGDVIALDEKQWALYSPFIKKVDDRVPLTRLSKTKDK